MFEIWFISFLFTRSFRVFVARAALCSQRIVKYAKDIHEISSGEIQRKSRGKKQSANSVSIIRRQEHTMNTTSPCIMYLAQSHTDRS